MNINENINDKFYDFINMYNAIIKHCSNKDRHYDIKLYYIEGILYFEVIDKDSNITLHNESVNCNKEESKLILDMITSEFILNHQLKYAAYLPMSNSDIIQYRSLSNEPMNNKTNQINYYNKMHSMQIHALENSCFTLKIYQYDGIDEQTELLHQIALNKISSFNEKCLLKK